MTKGATDSQEDRLVVGEPSPGHVVLNYGDPAYRRQRRDDPPNVKRSEAIFLRMIAYLAFVDGLYIPARYVLIGDDMWKAVRLAEPLIREGLVIPERRAQAATSEDLATLLRLDDKARRRGEWLDVKATRARTFRSDTLGEVYKSRLVDDLAPEGGFRRVLRGISRQGVDEGLSRAHDAYAHTTETTPEAFEAEVRRFLNPAAPKALRWAMARYYLTPADFDNLNTREMPRSAAALLVQGGVIDSDLLPMDTAPPVDRMYQQLTFNVPQSHHVEVLAPKYCEAVMEVRQRLPFARSVFREVRRRAELDGLSGELASLMSAELARQEGLRPRLAGNVYTFGTSLVTSVGGLLLGADPAVAIGGGVLAGGAVKAGDLVLDDRLQRRRRPWPVAISYLSTKAPSP